MLVELRTVRLCLMKNRAVTCVHAIQHYNEKFYNSCT